MDKAIELEKLDKAIKDAETSVKAVIQAIELADKEISVLAPRKLELEQNIEFHKKAETIPIINEHRKTKEELAKTIARLILVRAERNKVVMARDEIEYIIKKFKRDQENLSKVYENNILRPDFNGRKILRPDFGGKNGKK